MTGEGISVPGIVGCVVNQIGIGKANSKQDKGAQQTTKYRDGQSL